MAGCPGRIRGGHDFPDTHYGFKPSNLGTVPTVQDNAEAHRFEIHSEDGSLAGFAVYHLRGNRILFVHTEIDSALEGQGLGGQLIQGALDDARKRGLRVVPLCGFVARWIEKHPDYDALVDYELLAALDG